MVPKSRQPRTQCAHLPSTRAMRIAGIHHPPRRAIPRTRRTARRLRRSPPARARTDDSYPPRPRAGTRRSFRDDGEVVVLERGIRPAQHRVCRVLELGVGIHHVAARIVRAEDVASEHQVPFRVHLGAVTHRRPTSGIQRAAKVRQKRTRNSRASNEPRGSRGELGAPRVVRPVGDGAEVRVDGEVSPRRVPSPRASVSATRGPPRGGSGPDRASSGRRRHPSRRHPRRLRRRRPNPARGPVRGPVRVALERGVALDATQHSRRG